MVTNNLKVVWDKAAYQSLLEIHKFIKKDSLQNAYMVKQELLKSIQELSINPKRNPPDKFKLDNDGSYRAFEKLSHRIAYKVTDTQVIVLRIRHVKQEPLAY
jgi:plasmid stabilization system protein ParE